MTIADWKSASHLETEAHKKLVLPNSKNKGHMSLA